MDLHRAPLADSVDALVGLALDIHPRSVDAEQARDVSDHLPLALGQLWALTDHRGIDVHDLKSGAGDLGAGCFDEECRVLSLPRWVGIGEGLSDIWHSERAEEGIDHRMKQRIALRVPNWTERMVKPRTAKHERPSRAGGRHGFEAMQVVSMSNPKGGQLGAHERSLSPKAVTPLANSRRARPDSADSTVPRTRAQLKATP